MIAKLTVKKQYLPDWFLEAHAAHVPLPGMPARELAGEVAAWGELEGEQIPLLAIADGAVSSQYDWQAWKTYILEERYRELTRPLYLRFPIHYHRVPDRLRQLAARAMLRRLASSTIPRTSFPGFPIEQGFELLNHVYERLCDPLSLQPDPPGEVILTHDIDTAGGFAAVKSIAGLEMTYGLRSMWNVVACGYRIDYRVLDWLVDNGFEIGLHGYNHDNRLTFLSESRMRRRLDACAGLIERYHITSFRSPCWFRNPTLFSVLKDYFREDYSSLDTDIECPGGNGGCLWTKRFTLNGLIHTPTTIPFEAPSFFGYAPQQWVAFWRPKVDWLRGCGGNIVVNAHPDPYRIGNPRAMTAYEQLLVLLGDRTDTGTHAAAAAHGVTHATAVL